MEIRGKRCINNKCTYYRIIHPALFIQTTLLSGKILFRALINTDVLSRKFDEEDQSWELLPLWKKIVKNNGGAFRISKRGDD